MIYYVVSKYGQHPYRSLVEANEHARKVDGIVRAMWSPRKS